MFDKLKFWKKEDDVDAILKKYSQHGDSSNSGEQQPFSHNISPTDFSNPQSSDPFASSQPSFNSDMQSTSYPSQNMPSSQQFSAFDAQHQGMQPKFGGYEQPHQSSAQPDSLSKRDVELILSRLDVIRSELENVQHRLATLEQHVKGKKYW